MDGVERKSRPQDAIGERGLRLARLAELMVHLTECSPARALSAISRAAGDQPITNDNALDVLAKAMSSVKAGIDLREKVQAKEQQEMVTLRSVK